MKVTSTLLENLLQAYQGEGIEMAYTMEDFRRDYVKSHFKDLTEDERREALRSIPTAELIDSLPIDEIEKLIDQKRKATAEGQKKQGGRSGGKAAKQ